VGAFRPEGPVGARPPKPSDSRSFDPPLPLLLRAGPCLRVDLDELGLPFPDPRDCSRESVERCRVVSSRSIPVVLASTSASVVPPTSPLVSRASDHRGRTPRGPGLSTNHTLCDTRRRVSTSMGALPSTRVMESREIGRSARRAHRLLVMTTTRHVPRRRAKWTQAIPREPWARSARGCTRKEGCPTRERLPCDGRSSN
jgi:hypothetical protein